MINFEDLEMSCPVCHGQGHTENPNWAQFGSLLGNLKDWFHTLNYEDQITLIEKMMKDQPSEPKFFIFKECDGKGKILTDKGAKLVHFLRSC